MNYIICNIIFLFNSSKFQKSCEIQRKLINTHTSLLLIKSRERKLKLMKTRQSIKLMTNEKTNKTIDYII